MYVGGIEVSITGTTRITKTYYSVGAKLVAMRVITAAGSALYFLHSDHLGSVSLTTDGSGAVVSEQKYTAWGVVWSATGSGKTDIGFTGQRLDATGLMYFQARYYSASLARFISADTLVPGAGNPQALNRFSYVLNAPLKYTDPSGHCQRETGEDREECFRYMNELRNVYGLEFREDWGYWTAGQMGELMGVAERVRDFIGGIEVFRSIWAGTKIIRQEQDSPLGCKSVGADACAPGRDVVLGRRVFTSLYNLSDVVFHELGHVWDARANGELSRAMSAHTGGYDVTDCSDVGCYSAYRVSPGEIVNGVYPDGTPWRSYAARPGGLEDFAMAFQLWMTGKQSDLIRTYTAEQYNMRLIFLQRQRNALQVR